MQKTIVKRLGLFATASLLAGWMVPSSSRADIVVAAGWDLFHTDANQTTFAGMGFGGVPLDNFPFTGVGDRNTGFTDTIVQRQAGATFTQVGQTVANIPIQIVALQLKSGSMFENQTGPLAVLNDHFAYITLQSIHGGQASVGSASITLGGGTDASHYGTFDSSFTLYFDVRLDSLTGPIVDSEFCTLSTTGNKWANLVPSSLANDTFALTGVNTKLNGENNNADFFQTAIAGHSAGTGPGHPLHGTVAAAGNQEAQGRLYTFYHDNGGWSPGDGGDPGASPVVYPEPSQVAASLVVLLGIAGYGFRRYRLNKAA